MGEFPVTQGIIRDAHPVKEKRLCNIKIVLEAFHYNHFG